MSAQPLILAVIPELMFQSRVREQARVLNFQIYVADTMDEAASGLDALPDLVVVDLHGTGLDTSLLISQAKSRGIAVLAFGKHTEAGVLREARDAGCDAVVVRSKFIEEMAELLREHAQLRHTRTTKSTDSR